MTMMVDTQVPTPGLRVRFVDNIARRIAVTPRLTLDRPMVSFTFDDVPVSATTRGADILEENSARGTYYVAGSYIGTQTEYYKIVGANDIAELHSRGHEIGCHSFSHMRVDRAGGNALVTDLLRNRAALKDIEPSLPIRNFAYPYGFSSLGWKRRLQRFFNTSRTAYPRVNAGPTDPHYLGSMPLISSQTDSDRIERVFDTAQQRNGWIIFYGHDVDDKCSPFGCTPSLLSHAVRAARRRGIAIASIEQGWEQLSAQPELELSGAVHAL